jgi:hypothetical protein
MRSASGDAAVPLGGEVNAMPAARDGYVTELKYRANDSFAQI